jgi:transaldolase
VAVAAGRDHGPPAGAFWLRDLSIIPGRVSTEVDARLSSMTPAPPCRAGERIIELYQAQGIPVDRVLIKVAATWEGIQAANKLERNGIHTNLTLLFSFCQAVACGQAKVQLISPFVGRIYDWYKKSGRRSLGRGRQRRCQRPRRALGGADLQLLQEVRHRHRGHGRELSQRRPDPGAGRLRPADHQPGLAGDLAASDAPWSVRWAAPARSSDARFVQLDEIGFRLALNEDAMATEKLAEGIRAFCADAVKLEKLMPPREPLRGAHRPVRPPTFRGHRRCPHCPTPNFCPRAPHEPHPL